MTDTLSMMYVTHLMCEENWQKWGWMNWKQAMRMPGRRWSIQSNILTYCRLVHAHVYLCVCVCVRACARMYVCVSAHARALACVCEGGGRVMLVRHLCVLRVTFWCLELCASFVWLFVVRALGSIEKGRSKTSLLLLLLLKMGPFDSSDSHQNAP